MFGCAGGHCERWGCQHYSRPARTGYRGRIRGGRYVRGQPGSDTWTIFAVNNGWHYWVISTTCDTSYVLSQACQRGDGSPPVITAKYPCLTCQRGDGSPPARTGTPAPPCRGSAAARAVSCTKWSHKNKTEYMSSLCLIWPKGRYNVSTHVHINLLV